MTDQPMDPIDDVIEGPLPDPALASAVLEIESHIASAGWDQPARLYALVNTGDLVQAEPALAAEMGLDESSAAGSFTPIEQELTADVPLETVLESIMWPEQVTGCAAVVERLVLPPSVDGSIPDDASAAQAFAEDHPDRQEVRMVAGATRAGATYCALRLRAHDDDVSVVGGVDLVPALLELLRGTLDISDLDENDGTRPVPMRGARRERWHVRRRARGRGPGRRAAAPVPCAADHRRAPGGAVPRVHRFLGLLDRAPVVLLGRLPGGLHDPGPHQDRAVRGVRHRDGAGGGGQPPAGLPVPADLPAVVARAGQPRPLPRGGHPDPDPAAGRRLRGDRPLRRRHRVGQVARVPPLAQRRRLRPVRPLLQARHRLLRLRPAVAALPGGLRDGGHHHLVDRRRGRALPLRRDPAAVAAGPVLRPARPPSSRC